MSKSLLVTRPNFDPITNYFYAWSEEVIALAKRKGIAVYDLAENKAVRSTFESYLLRRHPTLIFINGHGNAYHIAGHENEILLDHTSKIGPAIMYTRSCEAGKQIGKDLVTNGALAFIGYTRKFIVGHTPAYITKPKSDPMAKLFLEPSNLVATTLVKGHPAGVAHSRSKDAMYRNFRKMISSTATYEERYAARWLWSNFKSQVLYGDEQGSI